jgi:ferredoxin
VVLGTPVPVGLSDHSEASRAALDHSKASVMATREHRRVVSTLARWLIACSVPDADSAKHRETRPPTAQIRLLERAGGYIQPNGTDERERMAQKTNLMVWIDQDLCTGDGICEEITPDVFTARDDGLWVVKEEEKNFGRTKIFDGEDGPDGAQGMARIPDHLHEDAMESAEECPGECIFIEPYNEEAVVS